MTRTLFPWLRQTVRVRFARTALTAFFAIASGCAHGDPNLAVALATPSPDARSTHAAELATIYAAAKRHDETTLLAMERAAGADSGPALTLALLTINRKRYADAFVRAYPSAHDALTFDYGSAFAGARVEASGARFPIAALGAIAISGDDGALAKLLGGAAATDGALGDAYRAETRHVIAATPAETVVDAFAELPPGERYAAISAIDWCAREPAAILAFHPAPEAVASSFAKGTPASASASPSASPTSSSSASPIPSPSATRPILSFAEVASVQAAIQHAETLDCRLALDARVAKARARVSARSRTANPKRPSPAPRSH